MSLINAGAVLGGVEQAEAEAAAGLLQHKLYAANAAPYITSAVTTGTPTSGGVNTPNVIRFLLFRPMSDTPISEIGITVSIGAVSSVNFRVGIYQLTADFTCTLIFSSGVVATGTGTGANMSSISPVLTLKQGGTYLLAVVTSADLTVLQVADCPALRKLTASSTSTRGYFVSGAVVFADPLPETFDTGTLSTTVGSAPEIVMRIAT